MVEMELDDENLILVPSCETTKEDGGRAIAPLSKAFLVLEMLDFTLQSWAQLLRTSLWHIWTAVIKVECKK